MAKVSKLENFTVKKGKSELFEYLAKHDGTAFLNIKEPVIEELAKQRGVKNTVFFGNNKERTHRNNFCNGILTALSLGLRMVNIVMG